MSPNFRCILSFRVILVLTALASCDASGLSQIKTQFGVRVPMRDGVNLSADIFMPAAPGRYPAILVRTPYLKSMERADEPFPNHELGEFYAIRGYVFVVQDTRGRGDSEGEFNFFFADAQDGYDSIEWIAAQSWCNGRVGMEGRSYRATVQWLAARERPPHLSCIIPSAPAGRYFDELPYKGGAFDMSWALNWLNGTSGRITQNMNASRLDWPRIFKHRPLLTMDEAMGRRMRLFREFLEHSTVDAYWKRILFTDEDFKNIDLPALTFTGWFDGDQPGAMSYWDGMMKNSPAREKQYLIVGPWVHEQTYHGGRPSNLKVGQLEFSGDSVIDARAIHLTFFEHFLKGSAPKFDSPRVRLFVTGSNQWLSEELYPLARMEYRRLYLHSGGKANTLSGDGSLSWEIQKDEPTDQYTYDPDSPAPAGINGASAGEDHRIIERRDDVLVYTSDRMRDPLTVVGRVFVYLVAASDARDTDFTAKILDIYPDGRALNLGPTGGGVIRARYRKGYDHVELLTPNQAEEYKIELFDIGHTFLPGHRVRIEISSSAYPAIDPNTNTGNPVATDTERTLARQTVYHDARRASYVYLPILLNP